ncbi:MAG: hypothetical protein ACI8XG_001089 [Congregibacter sp.]|jgi:hypothetical protein
MKPQYLKLAKSVALSQMNRLFYKKHLMMGIFEGMFESNIFTSNPVDMIPIEKHLADNNIKITTSTQGGSGPSHCVLKSPDGNPILFNQF